MHIDFSGDVQLSGSKLADAEGSDCSSREEEAMQSNGTLNHWKGTVIGYVLCKISRHSDILAGLQKRKEKVVVVVRSRNHCD